MLKAKTIVKNYNSYTFERLGNIIQIYYSYSNTYLNTK